MVAMTPENTPDEAGNGQQNSISVNLPTDGSASGVLPNPNEGVPPMPPPLPPPSFTPNDPTMADPRTQEVLGQINQMQYQHAQRSGEMPAFVGKPDMVAFAKAQARFLWEKMAFHNNASKPSLTDPQYIDLQNRYNFELERFVTAQMILLRQAGLI